MEQYEKYRHLFDDTSTFDKVFNEFEQKKNSPKLKELGECIKNSNLQGVVDLISQGVDPDFDVIEGTPALIYSIQLSTETDQSQIINYLLNNTVSKCNVNIPDENYFVALNHAIQLNNFELVKTLLEHNACETFEHPKIHQACKQNPVNKDIVEILLQKKYSPAFKDLYRNTAYDYLRDKDNKEEILILMEEYGFDEKKKVTDSEKKALIEKIDNLIKMVEKHREEQQEKQKNNNNLNNNNK